VQGGYEDGRRHRDVACRNEPFGAIGDLRQERVAESEPCRIGENKDHGVGLVHPCGVGELPGDANEAGYKQVDEEERRPDEDGEEDDEPDGDIYFFRFGHGRHPPTARSASSGLIAEPASNASATRPGGSAFRSPSMPYPQQKQYINILKIYCDFAGGVKKHIVSNVLETFREANPYAKPPTFLRQTTHFLTPNHPP
jgi:hypothetical protein